MGNYVLMRLLESGKPGFSSFSIHSFRYKQLPSQKKRRREKRRRKVSVNNGQLCIVNVTSGGARKPSGPKYMQIYLGTLVVSFSSNMDENKLLGLRRTQYVVFDC